MPDPKTFTAIFSDNAASGGVVLGGRPVKPDAIDLRWIGCLLSRNGVIEETGLAAGVLSHPATGIAWLANKLAPHDVSLDPGQILLRGSFARPVFARAGDVFHADYAGLGSVGYGLYEFAPSDQFIDPEAKNFSTRL